MGSVKRLWGVVLVALTAGCGSATGGADDPGPPDRVLLETQGATSVSAPSLAMNDDGVALVVWAQSDGTYDHVWSCQYTRETGWSTAQAIEGYEGTRVWGLPQVAIDAEGNGLAVWTLDDGDGTDGDVWASRYTHGTGWSTAERIESDRAGLPQEPRIAMDTGGDALVTWWVAGDGTGVWANRFESAKGWQTAEQLATEGYYVQPAVNSRGDAMVVYMISVGTSVTLGSTLFGKRHVAGTGWAEASVIETTVVPGLDAEDYGTVTAPTLASPQVTLAADGTALAAWTYVGHPLMGIKWARSPAEDGWGLVVPPADPTMPGDGAATPQLFGNLTGDAVAAWTPQGFYNGAGGVPSRRYHPSSGWGEVEYLQGNGTDRAGTPHLAGSTLGSFIAVWTRADETQRELWFNRFEPSTGWGTAASIATGEIYDPQAAIDGSGNALVVWRRADGDRLDLLAQAFPTEEARIQVGRRLTHGGATWHMLEDAKCEFLPRSDDIQRARNLLAAEAWEAASDRQE